MAVVVLAPFAAAAVRAADWLTPALSGVLPFRIRIGGGLAVVALLAITALVGTRQRHRVTRPDSAVPIRHYAYPPLVRRLARAGALAASAVFLITLPDLRYFRDAPGPVRLRLSSAAGSPAAGVTVDLLDVDRRPLTRAQAVTDAFGVAIVDVLDGRGRPVYLSTRSTEARCEAATRLPMRSWLRRLTWTEWERSQPSTALAVDCPWDAAVVMPFTPPLTSGVESPPVVSGPWPADPWMVDVLLRTAGPVNSAQVTVTAIAPGGASAHRRESSARDAAHWMVRPSEQSRERPTYVTLLAAAPGQKPVRLHLGPLTFVRRGPSDIAGVETEIPFEADLIPAIAQVARVLPQPGEAAALDVTVSNPLDRAAAITRVVVNAAQPRPPLTKCTGGVAAYDVSLTVSVQEVRPPGDRARVFPVHGTLSRYCGATEMEAAIAFPHELRPQQSSVLRFIVHEGVKRTRGTLAPLGPVLNDREYDWTLRLEIDRELVITGDYHPPRAVFGR